MEITQKELVGALVNRGFNMETAEITVKLLVGTAQLSVLNRMGRKEAQPTRFEAEGDTSFHFEDLEKPQLVRTMNSRGLHHSGLTLLSILTDMITKGLDSEYSVQIQGIGRITRVMKPVWVLVAENPAEEAPVS